TNTPEKALYAYFPEFKVLSLDYLDLTVFNENGESFIDMKNPELDNDVIHFPWKKRYQYIFEKLTEIEGKIQSYLYIKNSIRPKIEEIKANIRELTKDIKNLEKEEKNKVFEIVKPLREEKDCLIKNLEVLEQSIYSFE